MAIEFYYCDQSPPCQAVEMILREIGIEYEPIKINVISDNPKPPEFLKLFPRGKVPAIREGTFTLAESRAIAAYLCAKYEATDKPHKLFPTDVQGFAKMNEALHAQRDSDWYIDKYTNADDVWMNRAPGPLSQYKNLAEGVLSAMENDLRKHKFLAGDHLTVLDCFALSTIEVLNMADKDLMKNYKLVTRWHEHLSELPYYQKVFAIPNSKNEAYYKKVSNEMFGHFS